MKALLASFLFFIFATTQSLTAAEKMGQWSESGKVRWLHEYIQKVRGKLPGRVERVNQQLEENITLKYKMDIDQEPLKSEYESAANGTMRSSKALPFLMKVLDDVKEAADPVFRAEKKAFRNWEKDRKAKGSWTLAPNRDDYRKAEVFGTMIEANRLCIIIDMSPSMREYLPAVQQEIEKSFTDVVVVQTEGSYILPIDENRWWWAEPNHAANPFEPIFFHTPINLRDPYQSSWDAQLDAGAAVLAMAEVAGFDSIYWFTDFDDPMPGLAEFSERIEEIPSKIYIHPQGGRTPSLLARAIKKAGGTEIKTRVSKNVKPSAPSKPVAVTTHSTSKKATPSIPPRILAIKTREVDGPFLVQLQTAKNQYESALKRTSQSLIKSGKQESASLYQQELAALQSGRGLPATKDPGLLRLRNIYNDLLTKAESSRKANLGNLQEKYPAINFGESESKPQ